MSCTGAISAPESALNSNQRDDAGGSGSGGSQSCSDNPTVTPLVRLTNREYRNTLADLFPGMTIPEPILPVDNKSAGFDTIASAQAVAPALIEGYANEAGAIARVVASDLEQFVPCAAGQAEPSEECIDDFFTDLVRRAYRRPGTADELERVEGLYENALAQWGAPKAIELTVRGVLQAPAFLYRVEVPAEGNSAQMLSGYEMASRLSYLFWDSMPDELLLTAAREGELDSAKGVEAQARRLLADERAKVAVATFHSQWLRFEKMDDLRKSPDLFPDFDDSTAQALRDSTARYLEYVFWERGTLDALLTDKKAFVNDQLAPIYGVEAPGTSELTLVDVNPDQRSGVLTQAGLMAGFAHETTDAPVLRGVFVLSRFLCDAPKPPPPGIPPLSEGSEEDGPMTTRDRLEKTHVKEECSGCHDTIDGIGFGFGNYDAVGAWRTTDNGLPVNAEGELIETLDIDGEFTGAVALGERLARSQQVQRCVAEQWFRYALGVAAKDVDKCSLAPVVEKFRAEGNDLRELLIALVSSDAFRRRTGS
jgi:hypothetical protein